MDGWTKGPWEAGERCEISGWIDVNPMNGHRSVCSVYQGSDEQNERNARLIAAAPELAEAAEEILSYAVMNDFLDGQSHENLAFGVSKKDLLRLRAALAKAHGEPKQK